ncbi:hypothetical protein [Legionella jordanis]|uniref:Uncharacterized protein n=1 Tax=Legionella jordanis TaxID=456 RepID=A0A0W0V9M9_9GAMM|nr:hypothetical protein [Legionella jordanis]KTD16772.1 hypothetical protein Ljor_1078 [Legionella jordanis]RMX03700.1 hypothetical protein EAW55_04855 [Legionella jordanis]RMX22238.1 hypothetical protein EAS68_01570 [Legionella jordanis]VEH11760.1 Uncharacterised protein [Legionella jordanis]HAT8712930.1 hypothetical protein [Legionella jordanis]
MNHQYTAKIYYEKEEVSQKSGDDIEELYIWMLTYDNGHGSCCRTHGEIIDNQTQTVVRKFKKSPIE